MVADPLGSAKHTSGTTGLDEHQVSKHGSGDLSRAYHRKSGFDPVSVHVKLWLTKWQRERFFSDYFDFPISMVLPIFHTHIHLNSAPIRRTNGQRRRMETFEQSNALLDTGKHRIKKISSHIEIQTVHIGTRGVA